MNIQVTGVPFFLLNIVRGFGLITTFAVLLNLITDPSIYVFQAQKYAILDSDAKDLEVFVKEFQ